MGSIGWIAAAGVGGVVVAFVAQGCWAAHKRNRDAKRFITAKLRLWLSRNNFVLYRSTAKAIEDMPSDPYADDWSPTLASTRSVQYAWTSATNVVRTDDEWYGLKRLGRLAKAFEPDNATVLVVYDETTGEWRCAIFGDGELPRRTTASLRTFPVNFMGRISEHPFE